MKTAFVLLAFFGLSIDPIPVNFPNVSPSNSNETFDKPPEFFLLEWKPGTVLSKKSTNISIEIYDSKQAPVTALVNEKGSPVLYTSDIATPVCADGECKLMHIQIYWTLLGGYAGFDRYPALPLTKHEHDEFQEEDYMKLHRLLMDNNSVLGRRTIDQLVVKPKEPAVEGVDGVSGATIAAVKESVVGGALYSCFVAWHLVHGEIKDQLKKNTLIELNHDMVIDMLKSNNRDYQMFALNNIEPQHYAQYHGRIAEIFKSSIPLIRTFIIKNLPDTFWENRELQQPFWNSFSRVDINSRSLLLEHLGQTSEATMADLSFQLAAMTKNQLKVYLQHVSESCSGNRTIIDNLKVFSSSKNHPYGYLAAQYLEGFEE